MTNIRQWLSEVFKNHLWPECVAGLALFTSLVLFASGLVLGAAAILLVLACAFSFIGYYSSNTLSCEYDNSGYFFLVQDGGSGVNRKIVKDVTRERIFSWDLAKGSRIVRVPRKYSVESRIPGTRPGMHKLGFMVNVVVPRDLGVFQKLLSAAPLFVTKADYTDDLVPIIVKAEVTGFCLSHSRDIAGINPYLFAERQRFERTMRDYLSFRFKQLGLEVGVISVWNADLEKGAT